MARKRTGQGRPRKGSPDQLKRRIRGPIVRRSKSRRSPSPRTQSTRTKAIQVIRDLRSDPNQTPSQAARSRGTTLFSVRKYMGSQLKQERPGGRIRVTRSDRLRATLQIPSTKPSVLIPIHTKNSKERYLVGEWFAALREAAAGDFTRLKRFPKGTIVAGVRLPTGTREVQRILEAMESSESPFEQLYVTAGAA